jgi:hypothetical protein
VHDSATVRLSFFFLSLRTVFGYLPASEHRAGHPLTRLTDKLQLTSSLQSPRFPYDRYGWLYISVLITTAVYCANIYTAVTYLLATSWTNSIYSKCGDDCVVKISFTVGKWIFVGCIIFSFLLVSFFSSSYFLFFSDLDSRYPHVRKKKRSAEDELG